MWSRSSTNTEVISTTFLSINEISLPMIYGYEEEAANKLDGVNGYLVPF